MRKLVLLLLLLTPLAAVRGQVGTWSGSATARDSAATLRLEIENHHFFRNDEYGFDLADGYTLPGFFMRPKFIWQVEPHVRLSGGVHWLNYWGAHAYPATMSYITALPEASDTTYLLHILPWVQARIDFAPGFTLILGSLENATGHGLPWALYNPELLYAADPEAGAQLLIDLPWLDVDIWANWSEFIFNRSNTQERFYTGSSIKGKVHLGSWTLYMPLYAIVNHTGGEGVHVAHRVHNHVNLGGGIGAEWRSPQGAWSIGAEMMALAFSQSKDSTLAFHKGWALNPSVNIRYREAKLHLSYWQGNKFVPILGPAVFSNASRSYPTISADEMHILAASAEYRWQRFRACTVLLSADVMELLPWSGYDTRWGGTHFERGARTLLGFGIHLHLNPTITLIE